MIDDPAMVTKLLDEMQAHLPLPVLPTKDLVRSLRQQGVKISADRVLFIKHVFYHGDEGGIVCDVTSGPDAKTVTLVSLTHLRVAPGQPLSREIRAYQRQRVQRIAQSRE